MILRQLIGVVHPPHSSHGLARLILMLGLVLIPAPLRSQESSSAATTVESEVSQGAPVNGILETITADSITVLRNSKRATVSPKRLRRLRFPDHSPEPAESPVLRLLLRDGTHLNCDSVLNDGETLTARMGQRTYRIASREGVALQLQELDQSEQFVWDAVRESVVSADVLMLRSSTGALTKVEGIVSSISDETVTFDFRGQTADAPLKRVAAIRFFTPPDEARKEIAAIVVERGGSQWRVVAMEKAAQQSTLTAELASGLSVEIPLDRISQIDFSAGNLLFLAMLEPLSQRAAPLFDFGLDRSAVFGARRADATSLPGKPQGPSLEFLGAGQITYRLPNGFTSLSGAVELRPKGTRFTPCNVKILLDSDIVWQKLLDETKQPAKFELPVKGDQRLTIQVDATSSLPTGDVVLCIEPVLYK